MKIVIIGAMHKEIVYLLSKFQNYKVEEKDKFTFYIAKYNNHDIILTESGIGKVMAGMLITAIYDHYQNIDYVLSVGVAGGMNGAKILDVIACEKCIYGDVDITAGGKYLFGQMQGFPQVFYGDKSILNILSQNKCVIGDICTTDCFTTDIDKATTLWKTNFNELNIKAMDMETTAFAQACYFYGFKYTAIKAISDIIGGSEQVNQYVDIVHEACVVSSEMILFILNQL